MDGTPVVLREVKVALDDCMKQEARVVLIDYREDVRACSGKQGELSL